VLSGEYVVLQGAPAIAAAVDRRVRVSVSESQSESHCITAPGYLKGKWFFHAGKDRVFVWQEALPETSAFSLVEEVWRSFDSAEWPALNLVIDTQQFCDPDTGQKLGLGSSAAVAVALSAALGKYASLNSNNGRTAMDAHDRFQDGRGSGVDVATCLHGGLIMYRRTGNGTRHLDWPDGLHCRYLWSGQTAATVDKLARLDADRDGHARGDSMKALADHAEDIATAWSLGDARQVLEFFPRYIDALRQLSVDHDLGIFDAGHGELARLARDNGIVYKPCGAGGGDIGIVLAACEHELEEFCNQALDQNFRILDISLEDEGLKFAE
jgi:phosphomevalonate kinase